MGAWRRGLLPDTGINSFAKLPVDMAKQSVPTSSEGGVIGDGILFHLAEEEYVFVGRAPVGNWLLKRNADSPAEGESAFPCG
jgi:vanillate/3-O-methylgallate O-demethylase